jgi:hypothetical protein
MPLLCNRPIVKHFFYINPILVAWQRITSRTEAFVSGNYVCIDLLIYMKCVVHCQKPALNILVFHKFIFFNR